VLSFIARIVQGIAVTSITVTCFSIVATFYPKHRELLIGILAASDGGGMMMGPMIGSALFYVGGYEFMNSSFGGIFFIFALVFPFILPKFLD
jgi:MFS family permease